MREIWRKGLPLLWMAVVPFLHSCRSVRYLGSTPGPAFQKEHFVSPLPRVLHETSGLASYNGRLWSFNDSGGEAVLYAFLPSDPAGTLKSYGINGARNIDWEAMAMHGRYFYIADVGNNYGTRDTLEIYRVMTDTAGLPSGNPGTISFSYPGKSPEYSDCKKNPFDAEAIAVINDSLWLFTKNWQDESTCIYTYPANPGYFYKKPSTCLNTEMLVTGADYDKRADMLWLIGYHHYIPVIRVYSLKKRYLPEPVATIKMGNRTGLQTEGIACADDGYIYFSFERSKRRQGLFKMKNPFADIR